MLVRVEDVKITKQMQATPPKNLDARMQSKISFYQENGRFSKPIELDKLLVLTDGYISYMAAVKMGLETVECEIVKGKRIIYYSNKRNHIAPSRRMEAYNQYNGICCICGQKVDTNEFTIDHWIPLHRGGTNEQSNLKIAHVHCNEMKGGVLPDDFKKLVVTTAEYQARQDEDVAKAMIQISIKIVLSMTARKVKSFLF